MRAGDYIAAARQQLRDSATRGRRDSVTRDRDVERAKVPRRRDRRWRPVMPATRYRSHRLALSECQDCHDPIRFVKLDNGHAIPINPQPNDRGNVAAKRIGPQLHGHVIAKGKPPSPGDDVYMPHAATCPERPPKIARPKREPEPTLFDDMEG